MCGIVGYYTEKKTRSEIDILKNLFVESSIRGLHSFGVAYFIGKELIIKKDREKNFSKLLKEFTKSKSNRLIFHCRYSTSGDFKVMENNQPTDNGKIAIALNGIISMEEKEVFEKQFKVKCKANNDAEIILRTKLQPIKFLRKYDQVSFAGLFLQRKKIVALRNNKRPLYFYQNNIGSKFFFSTIDIGRRAGLKDNRIKIIPTLKEIEV